jgi:hypothetical protein
MGAVGLPIEQGEFICKDFILYKSGKIILLPVFP